MPCQLLRSVIDHEDSVEWVSQPLDFFQILDPVPGLSFQIFDGDTSFAIPDKFELDGFGKESLDNQIRIPRCRGCPDGQVEMAIDLADERIDVRATVDVVRPDNEVFASIEGLLDCMDEGLIQIEYEQLPGHRVPTL